MLHFKSILTISSLVAMLVFAQACFYNDVYVYSDNDIYSSFGGHSKKVPFSKTEKCSKKTVDDIEEGSIIKHEKVLLKRHSQTVIHKRKCDGTLISSKKEEIKTPSKTITVLSDNLQKGDVEISRGYNYTTCDSATGFLVINSNILGLSKKGPAEFLFTADQARTTFNTHVVTGPNVIEYKFLGRCSDNSNSCDPNDRIIKEEGTLILHVEYEVRDLDEEGQAPLVIEEECK